MQDVEARYKPISQLGQGSYGAVVHARDQEAGEAVAFKIISLNRHSYNNPRKIRVLHQYLGSELRNHRKLVHPNIVGLRDAFLAGEGNNRKLLMKLEFANGGNLVSHVNGSRQLLGRVTEQQARWFFQQLVSVLAYLHGDNTFHRDIKLDNMLLQDEPGLPWPQLKVCDFGFSKHTQEAANSRVGTTTYNPPELLQSGRYDLAKVDIWCAGISLFILLVARYPFVVDGVPVTTVLNAMQTQAYRHQAGFAQLSESCRDLLDKLLDPQPNSRIDLAGIQAHPWFQQDLEANQALLAQQQPPQPCVKTEEQLQAVAQEALQILGPAE